MHPHHALAVVGIPRHHAGEVEDALAPGQRRLELGPLGHVAAVLLDLELGEDRRAAPRQGVDLVAAAGQKLAHHVLAEKARASGDQDLHLTTSCPASAGSRPDAPSVHSYSGGHRERTMRSQRSAICR